MAYVYRHIRLDTNRPFYIGIGSDSEGNYTRAAKKDRTRSKHWHNIINAHGYEVEIMIDGITWEQAQEKEIEFIALYGRKQRGGILCNLTDGGGGGLGMVTSEETKKKQSLKKIGKSPHNKGKPMPLHVKEKLSQIHKGRPSWNKGIPNSEATREKLRNRDCYKKGQEHHFFGRKHSEEAIRKNREAHLGVSPSNKGVPMSEEQKKKVSDAKKGQPLGTKESLKEEKRNLKITVLY